MTRFPAACGPLLSVATLVLTSCAAPAPLPQAGEIVVASGGSFGSSSTQIFSDGTVISTHAVSGQVPVRAIRHGLPEAYRKAAAILAAEGLASRRAIKPQVRPCLDYGTDQVSAAPPIAGFDKAVAACPDAALQALMSDVLATLAQP